MHLPHPWSRRLAGGVVALALALLATQATEAQFADKPSIPLVETTPPKPEPKPETFWPSWRGPLQTGVSPTGNPPMAWSEDLNIRFKVEVPGRGLASPIVWGDKIFVLTAVPVVPDAAVKMMAAAPEDAPITVRPVMQRFLVLAYSREDGKLIWKITAAEQVPHESHYIDASYASASPVTDGKRLIAHFGSNGTYAYDLDGKLLWKTDLGNMTTRRGFGEGSSPALDGDHVVINWDHEGDSFIVGLDADTGEERWKEARPGEVTSWATPLIVPHNERKQVIVAASGKSRGYDLLSGGELWRLGGMTTNVIPSPVHEAGIVYLMSGFRGNMLQAVSLANASGDVEGTKGVLWTHERHTPYVPSPVLYAGHLYFLKHFSNILTSLDANTGEVHYTEQRLPGIENVYASPVAAAGRIYVFDRVGHAVVVKYGKIFEVLAENDLEEGLDASPAIAGDELFLRTRGFLYCISLRKEWPPGSAPADGGGQP